MKRGDVGLAERRSGRGRTPRRLGMLSVAGALGLLACAPLRTIDGRANNPYDPEMGATGSMLLRLVPARYGWTGDHRSAREISNLVCAVPDASKPASARARAARAARGKAAAGRAKGAPTDVPTDIPSDMVWQWGQFLDHDLDLTGEMAPRESDPIEVPWGDPWFDPDGTGSATIDFVRSVHAEDRTPREQINQVTAWLDGSNVYGSDPERARALRALDGSGRLATSEGELLPFNTAGLPNAGGTQASLFLAGDVRANEQVGLTAMHTIWVREHNRWADEIRARWPQASGDEIYEAARIVVTAELQIITYREFLPRVLGRGAIPLYRGYDPEVDVRIANEFSTASYRFGHSMLSPSLLRLDRRGRPLPQGPLALRDAFFAPQRILEEGGIEPLLRGLARQPAQPVDPYIVDDVRNFLFGPPGSGGFDLAALNIQRGRDHGLASYNDLREAMGFERARRFADVTSDPELQRRLADAYGEVENVELWVGGLAEDHAPGSLVGPLVREILIDQFTALRDGDRFWYARVLPAPLARMLEATTRLSTVIRRNSSIGSELPDDVFRAPVEGKPATRRWTPPRAGSFGSRGPRGEGARSGIDGSRSGRREARPPFSH